jgi:hypothetical protein
VTPIFRGPAIRLKNIAHPDEPPLLDGPGLAWRIKVSTILGLGSAEFFLVSELKLPFKEITAAVNIKAKAVKRFKFANIIPPILNLTYQNVTINYKKHK